MQLHHEDQAAVRDELLRGLMAPAAFTAPKYLYDALGSRLFDAITELPEYYPTRTEAGIFAAHAAEMARCVPAGATLVDLGAGNCQKAARLFEVFKPQRYVAVDISVDYLRDALAALQRQHPALEVVGVGMDFSQSLALPPEALSAGDGGDPAPLLVFYPGSSIGNFTPDEALRFLRDVHGACARGGPGGGLLIGVDRVKAASVLEPAYDDALGVTAAFNRNLLPRINRLAGTDFQLCRLAARGLVQQRRFAHRNAPGGAARRDGALARRRAGFRLRRAHPHRELVQMAGAGLRSVAAVRRVSAHPGLDGCERLVFRVLGAGLRSGRRDW